MYEKELIESAIAGFKLSLKSKTPFREIATRISQPTGIGQTATCVQPIDPSAQEWAEGNLEAYTYAPKFYSGYSLVNAIEYPPEYAFATGKSLGDQVVKVLDRLAEDALVKAAYKFDVSGNHQDKINSGHQFLIDYKIPAPKSGYQAIKTFGEQGTIIAGTGAVVETYCPILNNPGVLHHSVVEEFRRDQVHIHEENGIYLAIKSPIDRFAEKYRVTWGWIGDVVCPRVITGSMPTPDDRSHRAVYISGDR